MAVQVIYRDGRDVDGADGGCFVGVVDHPDISFSRSKVEFDEVGVEDELEKAATPQ